MKRGANQKSLYNSIIFLFISVEHFFGDPPVLPIFFFFFVLLSASFFSSVLLFAFLPVKNFLETLLVLLLFFLPFFFISVFLRERQKARMVKRTCLPCLQGFIIDCETAGLQKHSDLRV